MKIFVISSVRHAPQSLRDRLDAYANDLGEEGHADSQNTAAQKLLELLHYKVR